MWDALTTPAGTDAVLNAPAVALLVFFLVGFVASVTAANGAVYRLNIHPVAKRTLRRYATWGTLVFGAGLFFFGVRLLQINPFGFGMPLWLWLCLLAAIVLAGIVLWAFHTVVPVEMAAYEQQRVKQRYLRPGRAAPVQRDRRPQAPTQPARANAADGRRR